MEITEQELFAGTKCLETGTPWFTMGAIAELERACSERNSVIEIGSGGSTIFFARLCRDVLSIETNMLWYQSVFQKCEQNLILNKILRYRHDQCGVERLLNDLDHTAEIVSIDCAEGFDRSKFLEIILETQKKLQVLVLDNYANSVLFPRHAHLEIAEMEKLCAWKLGGVWRGQDFDYPGWSGNGTRIILKI